MLNDVRQNGSGTAVLDNTGDNVAATFGHAEHDALVVLSPLVPATNEMLVDLDNGRAGAVAADRRVAVNDVHVIADAIAHAPSRLVGDAKLALDFLGGDPVPRCAEQEHHVVPL